MSANCCTHTREDQLPDSRYRRVLWAVLAINGAMFLVEIIAGVGAGSASLQADALDFLADAANYGISLFVVGMALRYRASAALAKGVTMGLFGLWVLSTAFWHAASGTVPEAATIGAVGILALLANAASFGLLWAYRAETAICGPCGCVRATMSSAILPCCWRPWAYLIQVKAGLTFSLPSSWLVSRYKGHGSSFALRWRNCN